MTPEQIAAVQEAAAKAAADDQLPVRFYERLFDADPSVRAMFPADLAAQRVKFREELEMLVDTLGRLGEFEARARELGARHRDYGVMASHYGTVRDALLGALSDVLGPAFTPEVEEAWRLAYNLLAEVMMEGADRVPPAPR